MEKEAWINEYLNRQRDLLAGLPAGEIGRLVELLAAAARKDHSIFVAGNGGNAASASHFATDLGKGASDVCERRFPVHSLTDNSPWMTALGNDYSYDEVFVRQLVNFAQPGDLLITSSVSGNSPNLVQAGEWANANQLTTIALVGGRRGRLAELAEHVLVVDDTHYGRVEDAQMTIFHLLAYALMEQTA